MKLFVGLGNPGNKYSQNRHNIGFMAVETIARLHGFDVWRSRFQGQFAEGRLNGEKCFLLKPETYMNESGRSVGEALRFFKIEPEDVIVFHDELDLAPAKIRVKKGGGNAGHNGLKSISAHIGNEYERVRLGIGHPGRKDIVHLYVLNDFAKAEHVWLDPLLDALAKASPHLAQNNSVQFMNEIARLTQGEDDKRSDKDQKAKAQKEAMATSEGDLKHNPSETPEKTTKSTALGSALADQLKKWRGE